MRRSEPGFAPTQYFGYTVGKQRSCAYLFARLLWIFQDKETAKLFPEFERCNPKIVLIKFPFVYAKMLTCNARDNNMHSCRFELYRKGRYKIGPFGTSDALCIYDRSWCTVVTFILVCHNVITVRCMYVCITTWL